MKRTILGLIVAVTVAAPVLAQSTTPDASNPSANTTTQRTDDSPHHSYGWMGLLGLAGLAGLMKKRDRTEHSVHGAPSTAR
jgi:MYXO-CTERM domain-containing protein